MIAKLLGVAAFGGFLYFMVQRPDNAPPQLTQPLPPRPPPGPPRTDVPLPPPMVMPTIPPDVPPPPPGPPPIITPPPATKASKVYPYYPPGTTVILAPGGPSVCDNLLQGTAYKYVLDSATLDTGSGSGAYFYQAHHFMYLNENKTIASKDIVAVCAEP